MPLPNETPTSEKPITDEQRLRLINALMDTDQAGESDFVLMDESQGRPVSRRELGLATIVSKVYQIVHPRFSKCRHPDWEKQSEDILKTL